VKADGALEKSQEVIAALDALRDKLADDESPRINISHAGTAYQRG